MASMAVLAVLFVVLGRIFAEAADGFGHGASRLASQASIQSAMEILQRDLEGLVADRRLRLCLERREEKTPAGWMDLDVISFVTQNTDFTYETRALQGVRFYTRSAPDGPKRIQLMRAGARIPAVVDPYSQPTWWRKTLTTGDVLLDNIMGFSIRVFDGKENDILARGTPRIFPEADDVLPVCYVDVVIKCVPPDIMRQAAIMPEAARKEWLDRHVRAMIMRITPMDAMGRAIETQRLGCL